MTTTFDVCPNCEERFTFEEKKNQVCLLCKWPNAPKKKETFSVVPGKNCPACKTGLFAIEVKDRHCYGCGADFK